MKGTTNPAYRMLYVEMEIQDWDDDEPTVVLSDGLGGVDITTWPSDGSGEWQSQGLGYYSWSHGDEGGPFGAPEPGMTDALYTTSSLYTYTIDISDATPLAFPTILKDIFVWRPEDCPRLGTVDTVDVRDSNASSALSATPTFT